MTKKTYFRDYNKFMMYGGFNYAMRSRTLF